MKKQLGKFTRQRNVRRQRELGAVTVVEALIVISLGIALFIAWAQMQAQETNVKKAREAGRAIAAYAKAASVMLAEDPPAADTVLAITDLQDCSDPSIKQFLPCNFAAQTAIPFATAADGSPVKLSDLRINVAVSPDGVTGTIDFGIFRNGNDDNSDNLPDARPDLAAIALSEANENSGAGVLGYYVVEFRRDDPAGLERDPGEAGFDQSEIDALAGLQATVGAIEGDAPFLRLDGSNRMVGGITFENMMAISPAGSGLEVTGGGDLSVSSGDIVSTGDILAASLDVASATVSNSLLIEADFGAQGKGFQHLDQRSDIARIDGDVLRIDTDLRALTGDVRSNTQDIEDLDATVDKNTEKLEEHSKRIDDLKDDDTTTSPTICSPSLGKVKSDQKNLGYHYNSHDDWKCVKTSDYCKVQTRRPSNGITKTYQVRNSLTLACQNRSITFFSYCQVVRNEDCVK